MQRITASLAALVLLANCTTASETTLASRDLPPAPQVARADTSATACLAEAIYFEARGTGDKGAAAVAHVVVNRAANPEFPNSVCGVVGDGCQFSYRCDGTPEVYRSATEQARALRTAQAVLTGQIADLTTGALFFHSARTTPGWFSTRPRVGEIGGNVFYR